MVPKKKVSLIIPFYNDAGCPTDFVPKLKKELTGLNYELILVDDCSKDTTLKELESLKDKRTKIIHNKKNKDYGGAIMVGLNIAKGDVLGFTCGDGEVSAKDIVKVYKKMGNSKIIKAIRKNRQDGWNRNLTSKIFNIWSRIRFRINLEDINGYPVYFRKEVYESLINLQTGWLFNIDMFRKIKEKGYEIKEISINHYKRNHGQSKMTPKRIIWMVWKYILYS